MVQFLNSPQTSIPIMEDPTIGGFAKLGEALATRMGKDQDAYTAQAQTNTEQMNKFIPELVKAGYTQHEAVAAASQMIGNWNKPVSTGDFLKDAWAMFQKPTYTAPDITKMKDPVYQQSLKQRGISVPKEFKGLENLTAAEYEKVGPVASAYLKAQRLNDIQSKMNDPLMKLAVQQANATMKQKYPSGFGPDDDVDLQLEYADATMASYENLKNMRAGKGAGTGTGVGTGEAGAGGKETPPKGDTVKVKSKLSGKEGTMPKEAYLKNKKNYEIIK